MLNGDVPDLEMGGILIALRIKGEGEAEMRGFYDAMQAQNAALNATGSQTDADCHPYLQRRAQNRRNLTPLLAILLQ